MNGRSHGELNRFTAGQFRRNEVSWDEVRLGEICDRNTPLGTCWSTYKHVTVHPYHVLPCHGHCALYIDLHVGLIEFFSRTVTIQFNCAGARRSAARPEEAEWEGIRWDRTSRYMLLSSSCCCHVWVAARRLFQSASAWIELKDKPLFGISALCWSHFPAD